MNLICDKCGKSFVDGNREDRGPNGVTLTTGYRAVTLCTDCMTRFNRMTPVMKQLFILQLKEKEGRKS